MSSRITRSVVSGSRRSARNQMGVVSAAGAREGRVAGGSGRVSSSATSFCVDVWGEGAGGTGTGLVVIVSISGSGDGKKRPCLTQTSVLDEGGVREEV